MSSEGGPYPATEMCPVCGADIDFHFQFTSHYSDWYGAWESDVEITDNPKCPNGCELTRDQWDDLLVTASEAIT